MNLEGTMQLFIANYIILPVQTNSFKSQLRKFPYGMSFAGSNNIIVWMLVLHHFIHGITIFWSEAPVALSFKSFCKPSLILATELVILRVTNSSPRKGLS